MRGVPEHGPPLNHTTPLLFRMSTVGQLFLLGDQEFDRHLLETVSVFARKDQYSLFCVDSKSSSHPKRSRVSIKKQEFYEGAALHLLARSGKITSISYDPPLFTINGLSVLLKYSTKGRSPWGFTFTPDEQRILSGCRSAEGRAVVAMVCGSDGVAAIGVNDFFAIAASRESAVHLACYRNHREHYEVNGPDGGLVRKIPPLAWQRILEDL